MKRIPCEECGALMHWAEVVRVASSDGKEQRLCPDCAWERSEYQLDEDFDDLACADA